MSKQRRNRDKHDPNQNTNGNYLTTRERDFAAFDKLPKEIRRAIANSAGNWAAEPLLKSFRRYKSLAFIVTMIEHWNISEVREHYDELRHSAKQDHQPRPQAKTKARRRRA